ncbi:MAG: D-alanyl-D-alanine carboxypeptidase family protein [Lachnospiraceae bacterium]|nr:D-alanyl-D-alanine carboxypeptidase family protein [Lachnospiraceae bacterium]
MIRNTKKRVITLFFAITLTIINCINVYAVDTVPTDELKFAAEQRKSLPVDTNEIVGWPNGPAIGAQSAVLMDVNTGTLLYSKNPHDQLYPASTTKLITALLTIENTTMDEVVTFSRDAVWNIDRGSSHLSIDVGEQMTVEECLYGLLLASANEVAYALAEHVGGDLDTFVNMMNERAAKLGCTDTHFSNANGLPREDHYTSSYDLALIARECFSNETLCSIAGTVKYTIGPTNKQSEERPISNHHKLLPTFKYEYEGFIGGKTGFTQDARQTLVSCAEKNGMRLVCVIMKEESPYQFIDTIDLFDYGFSSFNVKNIAENETRYNLDSSSFFKTKYDILGSTKPILSINPSGNVVIPKSMTFADLDTDIEYSNSPSDYIAIIKYSVDGNPTGSTTIDYADNGTKAFEFSNILKNHSSDTTVAYSPEIKTVFVDVRKVIALFVIIIVVIFVVFFTYDLIKTYIASAKRNHRLTRNRYKKRSENKLKLFKRRFKPDDKL